MNCILEVCLVAARLTSLDLQYENNLPTVAYSYDGKARDISRFYENKKTQIKTSGSLYFDTDTKIDLYWDNGMDTDKLDVSSTKGIGLSQYIEIDDNHSFVLGGSYKFTGKQKHTPCIDTLGREYYCGTLTAWKDFKEPKHEDTYSLSVRYSYRF